MLLVYGTGAFGMLSSHLPCTALLLHVWWIMPTSITARMGMTSLMIAPNITIMPNMTMLKGPRSTMMRTGENDDDNGKPEEERQRTKRSEGGRLYSYLLKYDNHLYMCQPYCG